MTRHRLATATLSLLCLGALGACTADNRTASDTAAARADSAAGRLDSTTAARTDSAANATTTNASWTADRVIGFAHTANMGEIALGKLASTKATNAQVKAYGRQMVTDHEAMMKETHTLASSLKAATDTAADDARDLMGRGRDQLKELTDKAAGADWDRAYIESQVDDHKRVLEKLQDAAKSSTDSTLTKALVKKTAKVQEHLTKAENLKQSLDNNK